MSGVWLEGMKGRNVDGEWDVKPTRLYVRVTDGFVDITRSDKASSPTLIEVSLSELLRALANGGA